ncbi:MAG: GNAT family N-acetyltransferase [Bdellovibrionaceae bacterium]|jgi:hypothetical protein|nr:GNAT family N-acetyltransferase [Pseudobdellovibrionaceae bacterium]
MEVRGDLAMNNVSLRKARLEETNLLTELALRSKSYWKYPKSYIEKCRNALLIDSDYVENWPVTVGLYEDRIVGFSALKIIGDEQRLDHLWIEPKLIGRGIGTILFLESVSQAKKLGWTFFRMAIEPQAEGFYTKHRAHMIGSVQSRIKPDLFLPHMEYKI